VDGEPEVTMNRWKRTLLFAAPVLGAAVLAYSLSGSSQASEESKTPAPAASDLAHDPRVPEAFQWIEDDDQTFPLGVHWLLPPANGERVAYGAVNDEHLEQPILYSHKLHAGELKIDCQYCHYVAKQSTHAGVPPTQVCMNCHSQIKPDGRPEPGRTELTKLMQYWESGEPIPWVKVHDLPDFVYFSHKRHVKGGVACQECHGEVQNDMTTVVRKGELTMGWCLDCHKTHPKVNENYGSKAELRRAELKDCYTCHD
jgi:hypothetical protein